MSHPSRRQILTTAGAALGAALPLASGTAAIASSRAAVPSRAAAAYGGYVMAYFAESNQGLGNSYALHLAVSTDGLQWSALNQNAPVATPTAGTKGLRDPFIQRKQDGTFVILATDLNGQNWGETNQYIHLWNSTDLRSFTNYRRVKVHSSTTTHAWAPEAFWDAGRGQYAIIYSAHNGTRDVIMVNYTTDFITVGEPQTYFDPGFGIIDADVVTGVGGMNYLYYKRGNELYGARSASLAPGAFNSGTYTGPIAHGGTEAPILVKSLTSETWYLWGDTYTPNGVFYAWRTNDLATGNWTPVDQRSYTQPLNSKHAGITPIATTELNALKSRWGVPTWSRLKSYNYPDRFVRHSNHAARIDSVPFDPYPDMQWRVVTGLAGSGVSFESVNYPGQYLRHSDFVVVLAQNTGTAQFAADATFVPEAGLADSAAVSYRSYNYPTRYLRHSDYLLRIDTVSAASSSTDKQDATFLLTS